MISRTTSNTNAPFITVSCRRRLEALLSSPDMYTDQKFHIMKPWMENSVGTVALTLPRFGPTFPAEAPEITCATVPPPKLWFSLLKLASKPPRLATASAMKATTMPIMAIRNAPFCQRNVALVPKARITVCSTTMNSAAPIIQAWLVSKLVPQLISVLLWARLISWGTNFETNHAWMIGAALFMVLLQTVILAFGTKATFRWQNGSFLIAMVGIIVAFIALA